MRGDFGAVLHAIREEEGDATGRCTGRRRHPGCHPGRADSRGRAHRGARPGPPAVGKPDAHQGGAVPAGRLAHHLEIVAAARAGGPDWAEAVMRSHLYNARATMLSDQSEADQ